MISQNNKSTALRRGRMSTGANCRWYWLAAVSWSLLGCSSSDQPKIADYLDELEFSAPTESITNVSLGEFAVPIPNPPSRRSLIVAQRASVAEEIPQTVGFDTSAYRLQISFELVAETAPEYLSDVRAAIERRRGLINDIVLTTCRTTSSDELSDPRLAALKSRLSDELRPILGRNRIHQIVIENYVPQHF